ncbi:zinc-binding dehydrogenase [Pelistega europaea]|uniref:Zinc-binding dehydrogenase n=2 Tax=Pelistega europaea TaxID=106147 RepID=A0A7Y4LC71_9BURK|nr:zinc-binding dehydrogenase [Pelistega europaea]NOL49851.1 zinc-binding dehydrogenase [Pelistega europaea]
MTTAQTDPKIQVSAVTEELTPPRYPESWECCGSDCGESCVYTIYAREKEEYDRQVKLMQSFFMEKQKMRAIEISQPGGPEVLKIVEREIPTPKAGEVLIKVKAAGINRPDVFQRQGSYPPPAGASDLPGLEVAGEIVDGDVSGTDLSIGDMVCALTPGGGYAEYCIAPAGNCLPIPEGLSAVEAATLPETYFTVWSNVFDRGQLKGEETLLVHGGASGIGTTAILLARAFGHQVFATVGSDDRVKAVEALGATKGINYKTQDFVQEVKTLTGGKGVDVILDMVCGEYINRNLESLAEDGRTVIIAQLGGSRATINSGLLMRKRLTITGSTLRPRSAEFKTAIAKNLQQKVWPLFAQGKLKPVVYATFPFEEVQKAHAMMDAGEQIGKIVLTLS